MTLKSYLWGMRISLILSLAAFGLVIYYVDPQHSGLIGQFLFYLTLFLLLVGLFVLILSKLKGIAKSEKSHMQMGIIFRQSVLLSLLSILLLILQNLRTLTWWDGLLAIAGILLIELYFLTK
jgi:hypothetical protein